MYKDFIREEIESRLNSENDCYHSAQTLLSSRLLSKNITIRIHETVILPVVWYGCETWSPALRHEHCLGMFENRFVRAFGSTRDGITGWWSKLHNEELDNFQSLPNIIRMIKSRRVRWTGHVARARMGARRSAYRVSF
jgi:hypothetical protein